MAKTAAPLIYRFWGFGTLGFAGCLSLLLAVMDGRDEERAIYVFLRRGRNESPASSWQKGGMNHGNAQSGKMRSDRLRV